MKVLILIPTIYSLAGTLKKGFNDLGYEVVLYDYRIEISNLNKNINTQTFRFPFSVRSKWNKYFMDKINKVHIEKYNNVEPDIVMIYNNEMLLPETVEYFSKKSKILFFLGDNPFYTPTNDYFLDLLFRADLIVSPDSFWTEQVKLMGMKNCISEYFNTYHYQYELKKIESEQHDLLFIGMSYVNSWGYKRALFLSHFAEFDIKIHGNSAWHRWLEFFPELKPKFILKGNYSDEYMAQLHYNAKIYPFDSNPGMLNGIHLRLFDCIEYGILPIPEYRKDISRVFKNEKLPIVNDYTEANKVVSYYLKNDTERIELVKSLQNFVRKNYNPDVTLTRILDHLK